MESISICQICHEPINSHICVDCVSKNLKTLLPDQLGHHVSHFHKMISETFRFNDGFRYCIKCRLSSAPCICLVCYIKEFFTWSKGISPEIIRLLKKRIRFRLFQRMNSHTFIPIREYEKDTIIDGICEVCESYSDDLRMVDGEWICPGCITLRCDENES